MIMGRGRATPSEKKNPFAVSLGQRVAQARQRLGWTQKDLSREAHYDAVQLSRLESGEVVPRADALLRLAIALKASVASLYGLPEGTSITPPAVSGETESPWATRAELDQLKAEIDGLRAARIVTAQLQAAAIEESPGQQPMRRSRAKKARRSSGGQKA